jgi:hypothetical protein
MKQFPPFICVLMSWLLPVATFAKGDDIEFRLEGTVTNVTATAESIHFQFTGRFRIGRYVNFRGETRSEVLIDCKQVPMTVSQPEHFFADRPDFSVGEGFRGKGELEKILKKAAEDGVAVTLILSEAKMAFGSGGKFALLDGVVDHATDPYWRERLRSRPAESLK